MLPFRLPARFVFTGLAFLGAAALVARPAGLHAQAQATTGVVRGIVSDSAGGPLPGAEVVLLNTATNFRLTITTNSQGVYVAGLLPVGNYEVTARSLGYRAARRSGVQVRLGATVPLDFALPRQAVQLEELVATAEEPLVDVGKVESSTRLDEEVVKGLPNNGRNYLNLTLLTPNVAITQGPDGDELTIAGQRGIHNNVSVDGADFNSPFFGEQRGGQRPAFTFNLDAVEDMVVVASGANAEFGRSGGGFVNVLTKSGTNEFSGSVHYFGKYDALSNDFSTTSTFATPPTEEVADFSQHQFGATFGGPLVRDKAFFFLAYDQQEFNSVKQTDENRIDPRLRVWMDTAFAGALANDYGSIARTNDAKALLAKLDFQLNERNRATLKYNFADAEQVLGTFDANPWGRSANGIEKVRSHAINGSLSSLISSTVSNEFRFQWAREERPRPYPGPINPATGRPFPDTAVDFGGGYRFGMPFFLPIETAFDTRIQALDNVSFVTGNHLIKVGAEWNRTKTKQTFLGFGNGRAIFSSVDGFLGYVGSGDPTFVECDNGTTGTASNPCSDGTGTTPILLYIQNSGVGSVTFEQAGTQEIEQNELAVFIQDSWKPQSNLTIDYGVRWEAQIQPDPITPPDQVFFEPFIGQTVTNAQGTHVFPSDGTIPSDYSMFQPRLGIAWDVNGDGSSVLRASGGIYYARTPQLNLASVRSTNGSRGQSLCRGLFCSGGQGPFPVYGELLTLPSTPLFPDVYVADKDFQNARTITATASYERELGAGIAGAITYTFAKTDNLLRFLNMNDAAFGSPWSTGLDDGSGNLTNGIFTLWTLTSDARSRYHGFTVSLKRTTDPNVQFQINYTLSFDKADDDNERDPFTLRYATIDDLESEYNWSDRDQRHRVNAFALFRLPADFILNNRVSFYSAQPTSESCGAGNTGTGDRATSPQDRICSDGSVLKRNTIRRDNQFFSWDVRLSKIFPLGGSRGYVEAIVEVFNVFNTDNFKDPPFGGFLFNFDGTLQTGLGTPRQIQTGLKYVF
ncbi:MAG: TonB-dependent receptor [Gemmatimonadales bacterium]|nr:TonB-dependent receptor [Gemmatimonadales bacterium]